MQQIATYFIYTITNTPLPSFQPFYLKYRIIKLQFRESFRLLKGISYLDLRLKHQYQIEILHEQLDPIAQMCFPTTSMQFNVCPHVFDDLYIARRFNQQVWKNSKCQMYENFAKQPLVINCLQEGRKGKKKIPKILSEQILNLSIYFAMV